MVIAAIVANTIAVVLCIRFFIGADYGTRGVDEAALAYVAWLCVLAILNLMAGATTNNALKWVRLRFDRMAKEEQEKINQMQRKASP